jgi:hypothetical protein
VEKDRTGVAEYFVEEVRNALLLEEVPDTPCDHYLLPGPPVPLTASGTDGTASFDGERIQIEWNWMAEQSKTSGGPRRLALHELEGVDWTPALGWESGSLRFHPKGTHPTLKPQHDPNCLMLWGVRQARETGGSVLLAAAIVARLPHPLAKDATSDTGAPGPPQAAVRPTLTKGTAKSAADSAAKGASAGDEADHDGLLRRLRELGELYTAGVLTDDEFRIAKKAILDRF